MCSGGKLATGDDDVCGGGVSRRGACRTGTGASRLAAAGIGVGGRARKATGVGARIGGGDGERERGLEAGDEVGES